MPDASSVLAVVKWVALLLVPLSALWGLLGAKATREDEAGRKRLTRGGIVTVALIVGAFTLSALSFQLDRLVQAAKAAEVERERSAKRVADAEARLVAARRRLDAVGLDRLRDAERRASAAEDRAGRAEARTLAVVLASEARLRDLEIAQSVATGARNNLARTGEALTQIERVLQPLERMEVSLTWEIPGDAPGMTAATARLADGARVVLRQWQDEWSRAYRQKPARPTDMLVTSAMPLYPSDTAVGPEYELSANLVQPQAHVAAFAADRSGIAGQARFAAAAEQRPEAGWDHLKDLGDLRVTVGPENRPNITYVFATGAVRFTLEATVSPDAMGRTGGIVSYPDLERASLIAGLGYGGALLGRARLIGLAVRSPSRSYASSPQGIRRVPTRLPRAIFVLAPLRPVPGGAQLR